MESHPLRVLVVGLNYSPEPTGIAPYTAKLAEGLQQRGHSVRVLTTYPHYPHWRVADGYSGWSSAEIAGGVEIHRARHYVPARPTSARRILSEVSFGARVVGARWACPDVVICPSPALLSTAMTWLRAGVPGVGAATGVIVQDLYSAGLGETGVGGRRAADAMSILESWVLRRADGVVVIHDRFKQRVREGLGVPEDRVDVIRNWTHVPALEVPFDRSAFRHSMGWGDETIVLHTGAMGAKQGLANVVSAARLAESTGAPIRFVLIGDGKERTALEVQAGDCRAVDILDPLPGDDFVRALRAADLLLVNELPGLNEMAVPSKLTSYFSAGVAVLAATSEASTTAGEIAAAGAGVRVEPGDPAVLVNEVLRLREDSEQRLEMGTRGPAYCERLLSEEAALDAYEAWIQKLYRRKQETQR
ncbi:hypothetical protein ASC77_07285 [Nocardioides sp. Root1257]|uniref:glycosyltransferase n=1 Tax=unclassified Nocardioides TaxID=2615069 RepID=UPI00070001D2|nr:MULTISPECIES: glycosyltransferase [unclassified Nocardioides]KQW48545.1 hypothetical protein ASC77_07285 [Nocardioides sp. Root1257]KRC47721.1 hypothetical protein ASE24_07290 [Nocardioides sp. Root224]